MFIVNGRYGAYGTYYAGNIRSGHVPGGLLFRISAKILDALAYFGFYMFALGFKTDPVMTSLAF